MMEEYESVLLVFIMCFSLGYEKKMLMSSLSQYKHQNMNLVNFICILSEK